MEKTAALAGHKALPLTTMWQETADRPTMIRRPDRLSKSGKAGADGQLPGLWRPCMSGLFPALQNMGQEKAPFLFAQLPKRSEAGEFEELAPQTVPV